MQIGQGGKIVSGLTASCLMLGGISAIIAVKPSAAIAANFSCTNTTHDGVGADGATTTTDSNVVGAEAWIYIPDYTTSNLHGQPTTSADIAMIIDDSAGHYFQAGWYVGSTTTGLPLASDPQPFVGEGLASTGVEDLHLENYTLNLGGWNEFELLQDSDPGSPNYLHYYAYINGTQVWVSPYDTTIQGRPRMLGETNYDCADMNALATTSSFGPGLYLYHKGGSWSFWQEHLNIEFGTPASDPSCWFDGRVNSQTATVDAFDEC